MDSVLSLCSICSLLKGVDGDDSVGEGKEEIVLRMWSGASWGRVRTWGGVEILNSVYTQRCLMVLVVEERGWMDISTHFLKVIKQTHNHKKRLEKLRG